jgi:hypothetical protein
MTALDWVIGRTTQRALMARKEGKAAATKAARLNKCAEGRPRRGSKGGFETRPYGRAAEELQKKRGGDVASPFSLFLPRTGETPFGTT